VTFKHEEGNEGEKIGVKRRIGAFYGGKLLKRQGRWTDPGTYPVERPFRQIVHLTAPTETAVEAGTWTRRRNK
jgi:hypothetical protein